MGFSRQEYRSGLPFPSPGDLSNPGIKPRSPTLQVDSLQFETPEKPKNAGVGSLSLLQKVFPTQELYWGLLHCRQILYQLSYQGSPISYNRYLWIVVRFPWWLSSKESACNAGDTGLNPGSGRSPGGGHGNLLQYSCLENPMDRGACGLQSMGW